MDAHFCCNFDAYWTFQESALFDADMLQRKLELENKLINLQAKKEKMDSLLSTLKESRDTIAGVGNCH